MSNLVLLYLFIVPHILVLGSIDSHCEEYVIVYMKTTSVYGNSLVPININDPNWNNISAYEKTSEVYNYIQAHKDCVLQIEYLEIEYKCDGDTKLNPTDTPTTMSVYTKDYNDSRVSDCDEYIVVLTEMSTPTGLYLKPIDLGDINWERLTFPNNETSKTKIFNRLQRYSKCNLLFYFNDTDVTCENKTKDFMINATGFNTTTELSTIATESSKEPKHRVTYHPHCDNYVIIMQETLSSEGYTLKPTNMSDLNWNQLTYPYNMTLKDQLIKYKECHLLLHYLETNMTCTTIDNSSTTNTAPVDKDTTKVKKDNITNVNVIWLKEMNTAKKENTSDNEFIQHCYYEAFNNNNKTDIDKDDRNIINETLFITLTNKKIFIAHANDSNNVYALNNENITIGCNAKQGMNLPRRKLINDSKLNVNTTSGYSIKIYIESNKIGTYREVYNYVNCTSISDNKKSDSINLHCDVYSNAKSEGFNGNDSIYDELNSVNIIIVLVVIGMMISTAVMIAMILKYLNKKRNYYIPDDPPSAYPPGCHVEMYSL